jgi:hypothetical protein
VQRRAFKHAHLVRAGVCDREKLAIGLLDQVQANGPWTILPLPEIGDRYAAIPKVRVQRTNEGY